MSHVRQPALEAAGNGTDLNCPEGWPRHFASNLTQLLTEAPELRAHSWSWFLPLLQSLVIVFLGGRKILISRFHSSMSNWYQKWIALGLKSYNFVLCNIEIYSCPFLPDWHTPLFSKTGSHFLGGPSWRSLLSNAQCLKSANPSHLPRPQDKDQDKDPVLNVGNWVLVLLSS